MVIRKILSASLLVCLISAHADVEFNIIFPGMHSQGIKIYHGGSVVQNQQYDNKISFFIRNVPQEKKIFLLVINPAHLEYNLKKGPTGLFQNTIQNRAVIAEKDYKLYVMTQAQDAWHIEECELGESRIIPDNALIIFYNPDYISHLDENTKNSINMYVKNNVVDIAHGIEELWREEIKYLLETLHTDPLYYQPKEKIVTYKLCKQIIDG